MTVEEKARRYDDAIERAKKITIAPLISASDSELIELIFPELKESEDEKIRKRIYNYINVTLDDNESEEKEKWLAWLEKQGEKPQGKTALEAINDEKVDNANKVEPKFKVGDWCIDNEDGVIYQIVKVLDNTYTYKTNEGKEYSCTHYSLENDAQLWSIQDAKDGDVLVASDGSIFLFAGVDDCACKYYVALTTDNYVKINKEAKGGYWETSRAVYPATKEQRDLLFHKMEEEGYKWNAEKKELKKIEQKPTDEVIPKFKVGDWIVNKGHSYLIADIDYLEHRYLFEIGGYTHEQLNWEYIELADKRYHLWTIADAKDGDILTWDDSKCIALFKNIYDEDSFNSHGFVGHWTNIFESRLAYHDIEGAHPATKEQRDLLFAKMHEAGYEWDGELKKTEKFKVGDWIIRSDERFKHNTYLVTEVKDYYVCEELKGRRVTFTFNDVHKNFKLWDISDAKDGDVLISKDKEDILVYKSCSVIDLLLTSYISFNKKEGFCPRQYSAWDSNEFIPATKEQRDQLEKAMADAGYTFDFEKKELKLLITNGGDFESENCEQKPTWSEEDNYLLNETIKHLETLIRIEKKGIDCDSQYYQRDIDWLKSLKQRIGWKPNEEQMNALDSTLQYSQVSFSSHQHLNSLYNDLKKLIE